MSDKPKPSGVMTVTEGVTKTGVELRLEALERRVAELEERLERALDRYSGSNM